MGFARSAETSWTGEQRRKVTYTGVRPALDAQRYITDHAWVGAGVYGVIPIVRDVSTQYGEAEQAEALKRAQEEALKGPPKEAEAKAPEPSAREAKRGAKEAKRGAKQSAKASSS